ncbi:hypothetical protein PFISCL1PPCAC_21558, partial [Pristionchus fissidentatus]
VCEKAVKVEDEEPILSPSVVLGKKSRCKSEQRVFRRKCIACGAITDRITFIRGSEWNVENLLSRIIGTEEYRMQVERAVRDKLSVAAAAGATICTAHLSEERQRPQEVLSDVELTEEEEQLKRASLVPLHFTPRFCRSILPSHKTPAAPSRRSSCAEMSKTEKRQMYSDGSHDSSIDLPGPSTLKKIKVEEEEGDGLKNLPLFMDKEVKKEEGEE